MSEKLVEKKLFLEKYNIQNESFENTNLEWSELEEIYADHVKNTSNLQPIATYIAESLRLLKEVHSLRIRIKNPEHLIEKIIRKKLESNELEVNLGNYKEKITDLIGVRALHLFKEDWNEIHDYVVKTWELNEPPTANVRKGDPEEYTRQFTEKGCEINEHRFGYRSVHYLIKSQPSKEVFLAELQVRTISEEGWSEIDHNIRYPYDLENVILAQVSAIHNRLSGSADEIGSFIKILKNELNERDDKYKNILEEQENLIRELSEKINELKITKTQKADLENRINSLSGKTIQSIVSPNLNALGKALATVQFPTINASGIIAAFAAAQLSAESISVQSKVLTSSEKEENKTETTAPKAENDEKQTSSAKETTNRRIVKRKR